MVMMRGGTREQPERAYQENSFLSSAKPNAFNAKKPVFYYVRLAGVPGQAVSDPIKSGSSGLREKTTGKGVFLLGQKIKEGTDAILTEEEYKSLDDNDERKEGYIKGILQVL